MSKGVLSDLMQYIEEARSPVSDQMYLWFTYKGRSVRFTSRTHAGFELEKGDIFGIQISRSNPGRFIVVSYEIGSDKPFFVTKKVAYKLLRASIATPK